MRFPLMPSVIIPALTDLSPDYLKQKDIRLLMLDFDNTIVPYTTSEPTAQMESWLNQMLQSDIQLCVVSNSHKERVKIFCAHYGMDCITHANKPFSKGIRECMQKYGIPPEYCALVGDQIYTDTLGANCAGIRAILVNAIDNHNVWLKLRHVAEMPFILISRNRRKEK